VHIQFDRLHAVLAGKDVDCLHHDRRAFGHRAHQDLHDERHGPTAGIDSLFVFGCTLVSKADVYAVEMP